MSEPRLKKLDLSREETERFISFYLSQECLWNVRHVTYSKRDNGLAAQSMIAQQMSCHGREMTVEQVASKIASLRTYYGRELRKITQSEKSGTGVDDVYQSPWEFFAVLDPFLRCHVQQRPSANNLMREPISIPSRTAAINTDTNTDCTGNTECTTDSTDNCCSQVNSCRPESAGNMSKRRRSTEGSDMESLIHKTLSLIDQKNRKKNDFLNDPDLLFGQQVGLEIKRVENLRRRQELKLRIQTLIMEYQFENEA